MAGAAPTSSGSGAAAAPPAGGTPARGPAGTGERTVKQGECMASIAKDTGHFWDKLWNDAGNSDLRAARDDPFCLLPGDKVHVPPIKPKELPCDADQRHRFRRKGEPSQLKVKVMRTATEPRANQPYKLTIDGKTFDGATDGDGMLQTNIPGNAKKGKLVFSEDGASYELALGTVDPISEVSGIQQRLTNLGYACGPVDGVMGRMTRGGLKRFQKANGLTESGEADAATVDKLRQTHGS